MKKLGIAIAVLLVSCCLFAGGKQEGKAADQPKAAAVSASGYKEAPMLADLVKQGKLPAVAQRLPADPLVLPARDKVGKYGGTLRMSGTRVRPIWGYNDGFSLQALVSLSDGQRGAIGTIVPNLAKAVETDKNLTTFTFKLRSGVKWSDGQPLTTDDFDFYWNKVMQNKQLTPSTPGQWMNADGSLCAFKITDAYTLTFTFKEPKPFFLRTLLNFWVDFPKHYMQQFHKDFVDEAKLKEIAKAAGFQEWFQLFLARYDALNVSNVNKPRLTPYLPKKVPPEATYVEERNPYYWAVDQQGNQLPYIDRWENTMVQADVEYMQALAGQQDIDYRMEQGGLPFLSQLLEKAKSEGKYRIVRISVPTVGTRNIYFNYTFEDEVLAKIMRDRNFRIAMSVSINREQISKTLYMGLVKPQQGMPPKGTPIWEDTKQVAQLHAEYDPAKANKLLDDMGLAWDKNRKYRLRPDGQELYIPVYTYQPVWAEELEIMMEDVRKVGIHVDLKVIEGAAITPLANSNKVPIFAIGPITSDPEILGWMFLFNGWIPGPALYRDWYLSKGKSGVKPDAMPDLQANYERFDKMSNEPDPEIRRQLRKEIVLAFREGVHNISSLETLPEYWIFNAKLKNTPRDMDPMFGGNFFTDFYRPDMYFFED